MTEQIVNCVQKISRFLMQNNEVCTLSFSGEFSGASDEITFKEIIDSKYCVVTGAPGAGKSTLLKFIALAFADNKGLERLGVENELMPVLFPVAAFADKCRQADSLAYSLEVFIPEYFKGLNLPDLMPLFLDAAHQKKALFLIDGLDEVSDESERKKMVDKIRNFIISTDYINNRYGNNRFAMTCRTASYTSAARFEPIAFEKTVFDSQTKETKTIKQERNFAHYSVLPFDINQIESFLLSWYRWYHREIHQRIEIFDAEAQKSLARMLSVVREDKNILSIATNPLMLTVLALIEHEGGELPKDRSDLYQKCIKILAGSWENLRSLYERKSREFKLAGRKITEDFVIEFLSPIAYAMHTDVTQEIEYDELKEKLSVGFYKRNKDMLTSKEQADDFIMIMKDRNGILDEKTVGVYGFMHLTFQEYLAARMLTDLCGDRGDRIKTLDENLFKPEWREVILLALASLKKKAASDFLEEIILKKKDDFKNLILAAECVEDIGRDKILDYVYDELVNKLSHVAFGAYSPSAKTATGEKLGWFGVYQDLKEFINVCGGEYDLEGLGKVEVSPFRISKFPVTNAWFKEFIDAGGYQRKEFWTQEGKKWLEQENITHPLYWNDPKWNCPNRPVVGVSWYEAYAFTGWLTEANKDGYEYCLPTEAQWQAAAAGFEKRKWSWGNECRPRCFAPKAD